MEERIRTEILGARIPVQLKDDVAFFAENYGVTTTEIVKAALYQFLGTHQPWDAAAGIDDPSLRDQVVRNFKDLARNAFYDSVQVTGEDGGRNLQLDIWSYDEASKSGETRRAKIEREIAELRKEAGRELEAARAAE